MTTPIRLYQIQDHPQAAHRWTLPEFIGYATTALTGPTPDADPAQGVSFAWTCVDYAQFVVVDLNGSGAAYIEPMDAMESQCAILIGSDTQLLLGFSSFDDVSPAELAAQIAVLGGPSPLLVAVVMTPSTNREALAAVGAMVASAITPAGSPPGASGVVGVWNFTAAVGVSADGGFGRISHTPSPYPH